MTLYGSVTNDTGLTASIKAMHLEFSMMSIHNENILGFDKVGYQRKEPVVSSFAQFLGVHALSSSTDDTLGRLVSTGKDLDLALADKGYFQVQSDNGIKLTRDGRFKIDKDGYLLSQLNEKVLSNSGTPIKFPSVPKSLSEIKIKDDGTIYLFNSMNKKLDLVGTLGIVSDTNTIITNPQVKQGYNEYSNVQISSEFIRMIPTRRNYQANRKMFALQNAVLNEIIQKLSTAT